MPFQYTNRHGDVYHLQSKTRRGGGEGFSFTRKLLTGTAVDRLPDGYEVRELPDTGQVVLRKIKPAAILPLEKQLAVTALRQAKLEHAIVDVDDNEMVIWLPLRDPDEMLNRLGLGDWGLQGMRERLIRNAQYSKMMRFVLTDPAKRAFNVQRWCFRGSVDNWIYLDGGKPLAASLKKYVPHLGKESFYELM